MTSGAVISSLFSAYLLKGSKNPKFLHFTRLERLARDKQTF
jgi:hypothetical protein